MAELAKDVFTAPVGTIFVLAGVLFLFIAVIGKISGKIEPGLKARVLAGVLGSVFISIGLAMNWPSLTERTTVPSPPPPPLITGKSPQLSTKPPPESPTKPPTPTEAAGDKSQTLTTWGSPDAYSSFWKSISAESQQGPRQEAFGRATCS